jgi:hypothetical protein
MKYCISSRQTDEYLKLADEIKVAARDHKSIPDLAEKYPGAHIILDLQWNANEGITQEDLIQYNILCKQKFILCTGDISPETIAFYEKNDIKYYWGFEVTTPYELQGLKNFTNVCYVRVGAPLFFQQDLLKKFGIPVRVTPNVAYHKYIPQKNGINGTWIRPEDLEVYEPVVAACEFEAVRDNAHEQALFRIYRNQKAWPGDLDMIITNLDYPEKAVNRLIPPEFVQARLNCGQKCASFGACQLCYRYLFLADPERLRPYAKDEDSN